MKKTRLLLALASVALLAPPTSSFAQYYAFGKNKVQYDTFHWQSLKGPHVEVFYYPEEEPLARTAVVLAEESYADLAKKFQHEVPKSIPLIVFPRTSTSSRTTSAPSTCRRACRGSPSS